MIKHEGTAQTDLATDVFLALEQLQEVVNKTQDVVTGCVPITAIIWRDGRLHYKSYFDQEDMIWTDGLLIGAIASREVDWHDRIVTELDQEGLDKISKAWASALTGLESRQVSIDLANGRIPVHYGIEGLEVNPATFVDEFLDLPEAHKYEEGYLDLLESQLEALLAPLSDPSLSWQQVKGFADDLWFRYYMSEEDLIWVIDLLHEERDDISATLSTARDHLRLI